MGSLAVNKKVFKQVQITDKVTGLRLGPDDAYLITRGLRTLDVRLDKQKKMQKKLQRFYQNIKILNFYTLIKKIHSILECGKNIILVPQD